MLRVALLALISPFLFGLASWQWDDIAWQAQFTGAVSWSTYGVIDDNGVTDNTNALNSIPGNVPIIADCPHSGFVQFSGAWEWKSGLTIWQKPGCVLKSTIVTPGVFPIAAPLDRTATAPITNVQYYGWQFSFITPTSTVRAMLVWIDHFKFKYFTLDGSGGFAFLRGSDQEIAYGTMKNTKTAAGNPGVRHFGNIPRVATSPGMRENVWIHNNNWQTGDATFQSCQPAAIPGTWLENVSTDGLLYEDSFGESDGSAVILVSLPSHLAGTFAGDFYCSNVTYRNITGKGRWGAIIGLSEQPLTNVLVDGFDFTGTQSVSPLFSVGLFPFGGITVLSGVAAVDGVAVKNLKLNGLWQNGIKVQGPGVSNVTFNGVTQGIPGAGLSSASSAIDILAATDTSITNATVAAGNSKSAIHDDNGSIGTTLNNIAITNVPDDKFGLLLGASNAASVNNVTVTPKLGATTATGIQLTTDPSGTHNATVTENNVSTMPVGIICAVGQGNTVTGNTGASDCLP